MSRIALLLMLLSSASADQSVQPFEGASVVLGKVAVSGKCHDKEIQVWISKGATLLYQAAVPPNGTFEFHVNPGKFDVVATGKEGCFAERKLTVAAGEVKQSLLTIEPVRRDGRTPSKIYDGNNCLYCGLANNGMATYPNFPMPAVWDQGGMGINPMMYPGGGGGHVGFGKPNIYMSAPEGTKVRLKIVYPKRNNVLAAVPAHGTNGWRGTVDKEGVFSDGKASYGYLFYDFRGDEQKLQDSSGFCVERLDVISRSAEILRQKGFHEKEVRDFEEYWAVKMPPAEKYCVYPQEEEALNSVATYEVTPKTAKVRRVAFVVVPVPYFKKAHGKFAQAPTKTWSAKAETIANREPASDSVELREWSVAFMMSH